LNIGTKLMKFLPKKQRQQNIFIILKLIQPSLDKFTQEERLNISELYLYAGEKCLSSAAFKKAYKFLKTGIYLLPNSTWDTNYRLTLRLFNAAVEAACDSDQLKQMNQLIDIISIYTTSLLDKASSIIISLRYYNKKRLFEDSIKTGSNILHEIDYNLNLLDYENEVERTKSQIKGKLCQSNLDEMSVMSCGAPVVAIGILCSMLRSCWMSNFQMRCLVSMKMVQLTMTYGISKYSSMGFIMFGSSLYMNDSKNKLGYECSDFALALLKSFLQKK